MNQELNRTIELLRDAIQEGDYILQQTMLEQLESHLDKAIILQPVTSAFLDGSIELPAYVACKILNGWQLNIKSGKGDYKYLCDISENENSKDIPVSSIYIRS